MLVVSSDHLYSTITTKPSSSFSAMINVDVFPANTDTCVSNRSNLITMSKIFSNKCIIAMNNLSLYMLWLVVHAVVTPTCFPANPDTVCVSKTSCVSLEPRRHVEGLLQGRHGRGEQPLVAYAVARGGEGGYVCVHVLQVLVERFYLLRMCASVSDD